MPDCLGYLRGNYVACAFPSKLPYFKSIWRPRRKVNTPCKERKSSIIHTNGVCEQKAKEIKDKPAFAPGGSAKQNCRRQR
jgi:hypothetical protein